MGKRFKEDDKMRAIDAYMEGESLAEAAMLIGASQQSLKNWLDDRGIGTRSRKDAHVLAVSKGKGKFHGEQVYGEVSCLYEGGISIHGVACKLENEMRRVR